MIPNELFSSNRAPTDEEKEELRQRAIQHAARLQEIEPDIAKLEAQLKLLRAERDHILQDNKNGLSALSPFRILPEDILREVCLACVDPETASPIHRDRPPAVLTRISRDIRRVALSTPALWRSVYISYRYFRLPQTRCSRKGIARMEAYAAETSLWINKLSGALPLKITVTDSGKFTNSSPLHTTLTDEIMDVILRCCSRWESITFRWVTFPTHSVNECLLIDSPLLKSLTFRLEDGLFAFHSHKFLQAPNLQKFVLLLQRQHDIKTDTINWAKLTHLSLERYIWPHSTVLSSVSRILQQTPLLVNLCLHLPYVSEKTPLIEVHLPCLHTLTVKEVLERDTLGILKLINAPILHALSIKNKFSTRTDAILHLLNLSPNVTSFHIQVAPSYTRLVKYLRHCPSLRVLKLGGVGTPTDLADPLLKALVLYEHICPQLERFKCDIALMVSADAVVEFSQKGSNDEPMLSLWSNIHFYIHDPNELQRVIKQLDEAGIPLPPGQITPVRF